MSRRQAREAALQALFQLDLNGEENIAEQEKYETLAVDMALGEAELLGKKDRAYVTEVVHGTRENLVSIDADIAGAAKNWKVAATSFVWRSMRFFMPKQRLAQVLLSMRPSNLQRSLVRTIQGAMSTEFSVLL